MKRNDDMAHCPRHTAFERLWRMFPQLRGISWPKPKPELRTLWRGRYMISFGSEPVPEQEPRGDNFKAEIFRAKMKEDNDCEAQ